MKSALVGFAALAATGAALTAYFLPEEGGEGVAVGRGDIVHTLVALGRVESERTLEIVPKVPGRIAAVFVHEGDVVAAGDPLVQLEGAALEAALDEARQAHEAARARWDEVRRGTRPERIAEAEAAVREAESQRSLALAQLAELERGARPEDLEEAEAGVDLAQAEATFAGRELERVTSLVGQGVLRESDRDRATRDRDGAAAALRRARALRDRLRNGATEEELDQARARLATAGARLDQAAAVLERLRAGATEEERRAAEADLERAASGLRRLESELAEARIAAPVAGVISRRYREPGELAHPEMPVPILVLAEQASRRVRVEVLETDIYKVRAGQRAVLTSDSFPGRRFGGRVTRIAPTLGKKRLRSENPKEKTDLQVLEVWIQPDEPLLLPLGLPVEARIEEVVREDVLVLPSRLVDPAGGVTRVGPEAQRVELELGERDDAYVEVLEGLEEGERVVRP